MNDYKNRKGQALSMQWVAFLLQSVNIDLLKGGNITKQLLDGVTSHGRSQSYAALGVGCTYTVNFILPLAIEMGLKALLLNEGSLPKRTHSLSTLYNQLSKETKDLLNSEFLRISEQETPKFEDVLIDHKDDFENWRYLDDPALVSRNEITLQKVIYTILNVDDNRARDTSETKSIN